jgi:hypothetical protein
VGNWESGCTLGETFAFALAQVSLFLRSSNANAARTQANHGELASCNSAAHGINVHTPSLGDLIQAMNAIGVKLHRASCV